MKNYEQLIERRDSVKEFMGAARQSDELKKYVNDWIGDISLKGQTDLEKMLIKAREIGGNDNMNGLTQRDDLTIETLLGRVVRSSIRGVLKTELNERYYNVNAKESDN